MMRGTSLALALSLPCRRGHCPAHPGSPNNAKSVSKPWAPLGAGSELHTYGVSCRHVGQAPHPGNMTESYGGLSFLPLKK